MTLAQIRELVRRQSRDVPAVDWTNADLDAVINVGYSMVQTRIVSVFKNAHLFWDTIPTVSGTTWYPLPATFGIRRVGLKSLSTDTRWIKLDVKPYTRIESYTANTAPTGTPTGKSYYALEGQWIGIFPAPSVGLSDGIQLIHTPLMSLSGDTDVPRIKLPLHMAIVYETKIILYGDTDEDTSRTEAKLEKLYASMPLWYEAHSEAIDKFSVEGIRGTPVTMLDNDQTDS